MQPITSLQPPPSAVLNLSRGVQLEENGQKHGENNEYSFDNQMKLVDYKQQYGSIYEQRKKYFEHQV